MIDWTRVGEWAVLLGAGSGLTKILEWVLGRRNHKVDQTVKLGSAWETLVNRLQEQVTSLEIARVQTMQEITGLKRETSNRDARISLLEDENEALGRKVEHLGQENRRLCREVSLLRSENEELREELEKHEGKEKNG
jgi:chromosome segregation ATPase